MSTKAKLIFGDDIHYTNGVKAIDYAEVKIRNFDSLNGGFMRKILAYIYILTVAMGIIFFLSK